MFPNQDQALSAVRWLITLVGGYLVSKGRVDASQVQLMLGAAVALVPLIWSFIVKTQTAQIKAVANEPGLKVVVGPAASPAAKALAANPAAPRVVKAGSIEAMTS